MMEKFIWQKSHFRDPILEAAAFPCHPCVFAPFSYCFDFFSGAIQYHYMINVLPDLDTIAFWVYLVLFEIAGFTVGKFCLASLKRQISGEECPPTPPVTRFSGHSKMLIYQPVQSNDKTVN